MPRDVDLIPGATSTLRRRLFAKIARTRSRRECWAWTGKTVKKRGGVRPAIQVGGRGTRTISVARILLVLKDRVPLSERDAARLEGGHKCGRYWCVNQSHLEWIDRGGNEDAKAEYDEGYEQFSADVEALAVSGGAE